MHGTVPRALYQASVIPTLDAYADGWGIANVIQIVTIITNPATNATVFEADADVARRLMGVQLSCQATADGTIVIGLKSVNRVGNAGNTIGWCHVSLTATGGVSPDPAYADEVFSGLTEMPLILPGYDLQMDVVRGPNDIANLTLTYAEVPAGFYVRP